MLVRQDDCLVWGPGIDHSWQASLVQLTTKRPRITDAGDQEFASHLFRRSEPSFSYPLDAGHLAEREASGGAAAWASSRRPPTPSRRSRLGCAADGPGARAARSFRRVPAPGHAAGASPALGARAPGATSRRSTASPPTIPAT
jgi:hypothetical protein